MSNNNALKLVSFGTLGVVSNEIFGCVFWLKLHAHSPVITIFHHVAEKNLEITGGIFLQDHYRNSGS